MNVDIITCKIGRDKAQRLIQDKLFLKCEKWRNLISKGEDNMISLPCDIRVAQREHLMISSRSKRALINKFYLIN